MRGLPVLTAMVLGTVVLGATCTDAAAQTATRRRKLEIDIGGVWTGSGTFGSANANLTKPDGSPLTLFSTSNDLTTSFGPEAHVVFELNRRLQAELTGSWSRADFRSTITGDFEGAEPTTATLSVSIYTAEASVVFYLRRHGKLDPFVRGGAGWLREVTSGGELGADGAIANAGAGVKYWLRDRDRGAFRRFGVRAELRVTSRSGGLSLDLTRRLIAPSASVGAILGF